MMNIVKSERCALGVLALFLVLFFGRVSMKGIEHSKYKDKFKAMCEENGGVMFVPKGVVGWAVPECRNPNSIIDINLDR